MVRSSRVSLRLVGSEGRRRDFLEMLRGFVWVVNFGK